MIDPDNRYGRELKASEEFFRFGQDHSLAFYAQLLSMRRRAVSSPPLADLAARPWRRRTFLGEVPPRSGPSRRTTELERS
jgi:hypothetical protein